ncbi:MAG: AAA family ATPase [Bacteroidales bacterium]|jgi:exonuclease SbcC|nr:AAA family ATPase [Bacteroidales bacterium]
MKILKIRFENINSLKGVHEIDFSVNPLASAGLFAITGATGTGKTTILDVITLALFDRIPRVDEKISKGLIERTGLIITRNMNSCFAEVSYQCIKGIFTSKWSISKTRTGTLREYELELYDSSGALLDLKKTEVPPLNEKNIGLNFDQFIKAIILAQGDFSAFLKAKGDERGKLLEQITGSWIYRELGKAAFSKNRQFGQELENLLAREKDLRNRLLDDDSFAKLLSELAERDSAIKTYAARIKTLNDQKKLKEDIRQLTSNLAVKETREKELAAEHEEFIRLNGARLEKHRKLMPFSKKLWDWQQLVKNLISNTERQGKILQDIAGCKNRDEEIRKEVARLTGSEDEVPAALDAFEKKVLEIERQKAEKDTLAATGKKEIVRICGELKLKPDLSNPGKMEAEVSSLKAEKDSSIGRLTAGLDPELLESPETGLRKVRSFSEFADRYKTEKLQLNNLRQQLEKNNKELSEALKVIDELPEMIAKAKDKKTKADLIQENLTKERRIRELSASLEEHRKQLTDGEPCPLCGSVHHPYSEHGPAAADELAGKIKEAGEECELCRKALFSLETRLNQNTEIKEKKSKEIAGIERDILKVTEKCNSALSGLPEEYRSMEPQNILDSLRTLTDDLEKLISESAAKTKLNDLTGRLVTLLELTALADELHQKRRLLFSGIDVRQATGSLMKRFTENNTTSNRQLEDKKELDERVEKDRKDLTALEEELKNELPDYPVIGKALEDIIKETDYRVLSNREENLKNSLLEINTTLKEFSSRLSEMKLADTPAQVEDLNAELETVGRKLEEENILRDGLVTRKGIQTESLKELETVNADIERQKKTSEKWVLLNKYIGDAEGRKFSTFAQQLTLFQLVKLANRRLRMLNDRYQLDIPEEDKDDSLNVIDTHMGDLKRSVKSLSGGESFLVSLALALALSDLASRQVDIKSLFIDEGFGSLDRLTLDMTIDTLEKLQFETSKTIGVISHIEAMQERIATQIRLTRNGQGYSSMEIV